MKTIVAFLSIFLLSSAQAEPVESNFDRFFCEEKESQGECAIYGVSIMNLITTPELFHGKRIRIAGYLSIGFEESALYFSKTDPSFREAVLIAVGDGPLETEADVDSYNKKEREVKKQFNHRYVLIEGEFDMYDRDRLYRGGIRKITRIRRWR